MLGVADSDSQRSNRTPELCYNPRPVVTVSPKPTIDECMNRMTAQDLTINRLHDDICGKYPA